MRIVLNNREEEIGNETMTVDEMLLLKKFSYKMRVVKINGALIPKDEYSTTYIHSGDDVQMFYLMSGG